MRTITTLDKSRVDVLIYSHDGRGLGHASRGVTVGMALRRLFPELKVLFVSGVKHTAKLIGPSPLEWIKLPSYETRIVGGKARGRVGYTNIKNCYLGPARANLIESIIENFKPRCVLVDHEPLGKRKELLPSLRLTQGTDTLWILGIRAVVGNVDTIWSESSRNTFKEHYHSLLWYGDEKILGGAIPESLGEYFGATVVTTGYIARYLEMKHWSSNNKENYAGTIAVPWLSELSLDLVESLGKALYQLGERYGTWIVFTQIDKLTDRAKDIRQQLESLPFCQVENVSDRYLATLGNSRVAIIYGGYNSLTDIMAARVPSVVVIRSMDDKEQDEHVRKINQSVPGLIHPLSESEVTWNTLYEAIQKQLDVQVDDTVGIKLNGSTVTAETIVEILGLSP